MASATLATPTPTSPKPEAMAVAAAIRLMFITIPWYHPEAPQLNIQLAKIVMSSCEYPWY